MTCLYSGARVMLKLRRRASGHLVTLIDIGLHPIDHIRILSIALELACNGG